MPVLLGCGEHDPHLPIAHVRETEAVMRELGAEVVTRIYPGGGHGINEDEVPIARKVLARVAGATPPAWGWRRSTSAAIPPGTTFLEPKGADTMSWQPVEDPDCP